LSRDYGFFKQNASIIQHNSKNKAYELICYIHTGYRKITFTSWS